MIRPLSGLCPSSRARRISASGGLSTFPRTSVGAAGCAGEGTGSQSLAGTQSPVEMECGHLGLGHVAGKLREQFVRIVPGDKVRVELSPYDLAKGRITYRER